MSATVRIIGESQRQYAKRLIDEVEEGYVMHLAAETRREAQNRRMWPMIKDLREQIKHVGEHTPDDVKLQFLDALKGELRFLPKLSGEGMFPVGARSSTLTVQQFAGLIELMFAYGAKYDVVWSDPSQRLIEEVRA